MCGGTDQSPINIETSSTVNETSWSKFTFTDYDSTSNTMKITNNGHLGMDCFTPMSYVAPEYLC